METHVFASGEKEVKRCVKCELYFEPHERDSICTGVKPTKLPNQWCGKCQNLTCKICFPDKETLINHNIVGELSGASVHHKIRRSVDDAMRVNRGRKPYLLLINYDVYYALVMELEPMFMPMEKKLKEIYGVRLARTEDIDTWEVIM